jgi:hypothetical protein
MHVTTIGLVLLANVMPIPPIVVDGFFYTSFVFVIVSGFNYIYRASRFIEAVRVEETDDAGGEE